MSQSLLGSLISLSYCCSCFSLIVFRYRFAKRLRRRESSKSCCFTSSILTSLSLNHNCLHYLAMIAEKHTHTNLSKMQFSSMPLFRLSYSRRRFLISTGSSIFSSHGGRGISIRSPFVSSGESPRYPRADTIPMTAGLWAVRHIPDTSLQESIHFNNSAHEGEKPCYSCNAAPAAEVSPPIQTSQIWDHHERMA